MIRANKNYRRESDGFTLIELVVVIIITGIILAMVSLFMRAPIQNYFDVALQGELTDTADTALRKIARDMRRALPNSVRTRNADTNCIEFIPTVSGARYRAMTEVAGGAGDILRFDVADATFNFFGALTPAPVTDDRIVVYNLGIDGADAYRGQNIAAVQGVAGNTITLQAATLFPFESPSNRFQVVPKAEHAVTYTCSGGKLYRYVGTFTGAAGTYTIQNDPSASACPVPPPLTTPILATNVSSCVFEYTAGVTARNGLATLRLGLTKDDATVTLYHEVHVDNVP